MFICLSPSHALECKFLEDTTCFPGSLSQQGVGAIVCVVIGPATPHSPRLRGDPAQHPVLAGGAGGNRASQNDFCCRISDEVEVLFLVWFRG